MQRGPVPLIAAPDAAAAAAVAGRPPVRAGLPALALRHRQITCGLLVIGTVALAVALAPWVAPHPPELQVLTLRLAPPGTQGYPLGVDALGRDVFSRLVWAGRVSFAIGLFSMAIALVVGVAVGSLAGYFGGWTDRLLMRLTDIVLVFPTFFLLILMVATFGRGVELLIVSIGLTSWPTNARVVRALTLKLRQQDFVTAGLVAGATHSRIVVRHLVPHLVPVITASATIRVAANILVEAGLSYLGLGVGEPTPSWGNMVQAGATYMRQAPWLVAIPGAAIFVVVLAFNLLGEGLRDARNPRRDRP